MTAGDPPSRHGVRVGVGWVAAGGRLDRETRMTPFVNDPDFQLFVGDVRECLRELADESVHCVVTSPPYWGLRDYGTEGQIGLEPTPEAFVAAMVEVFREVRRVLRGDGTLWLNLGDSYASVPGSGRQGAAGQMADRSVVRARAQVRDGKAAAGMGAPARPPGVDGIKPKDLVGIPWRVAFALQADGWTLRSDIVWAKSNPMPESVTDRPTKAHEMVFLFSKARWVGPERGRYADISDEDARWLALLFDAEGNVVIKKARNGERTQYGAQVAFANTSRALIVRAQAIVGAGSIHERAGTNAPMFYWQMTGQQARDLLYRIYPFLIVKQRQAAVAIHMQDVIAEPKKRPGGYRSDEHTAFLDKCWETVKALNSFGDPDLSWVPLPRYGKWDSQPYFFDQEAVREPAEWARWGDQTNRKHEGSGSAAGWITSKSKAELQRPQARRAMELFEQAGLTEEHARAIRSVGITDTGKATVTQNGTGKSDPALIALAQEAKDALGGYYREFLVPNGRNVRSVWEIATQPFPEAHFATFPEALPERCIKAGTSERGCCPECGAPWEREVERELEATRGRINPEAKRDGGPFVASSAEHSGGVYGRYNVTTTGWRAGCDCTWDRTREVDGTFHRRPPDPVPCTVLDPFMGSGTTAYVARKLGRRAVGIELNEEYAKLAARRLQQQSLFAVEVA